LLCTPGGCQKGEFSGICNSVSSDGEPHLSKAGRRQTRTRALKPAKFSTNAKAKLKEKKVNRDGAQLAATLN